MFTEIAAKLISQRCADVLRRYNMMCGTRTAGVEAQQIIQHGGGAPASERKQLAAIHRHLHKERVKFLGRLTQTLLCRYIAGQ